MSSERLNVPSHETMTGAVTLVEARFVPQRYEPNYPYPLLVLLHARGVDGVAVRGGGAGAGGGGGGWGGEGGEGAGGAARPPPPQRQRAPVGWPPGRVPVVSVRPPAHLADARGRRHLADQPLHRRPLR